MSISGDLVRIGLNGPRISRGASGFMSHRSTWLGAPRLNIMIHARLSWPGFTAPCSFAASNCGSDRPTEPSAPICRNSRRFKWLPPQMEAFSSARKSNMIHLSFRGCFAPQCEVQRRLPSWQPFAQRKRCRIDKRGRLFHLLRPRCSKILGDSVQGGLGHYPKNLQRDEEWWHRFVGARKKMKS